MGYKDENKKSYVHYVTPARLDKGWPANYNFILVESMDHLKEVFKEYREGETIFSMDLETTSLDPEVGFIVSVEVSFDGVTGYHIPINHYDDDYNMYDEGLDYVYEKMVKAKRVLVFGGKFDIRFWEYHGWEEEVHGDLRLGYVRYDMSKVDIFDVSIPIWLSDTNLKMPSLKWASLHFLGIKQPSFQETTAGVENFHYIPPEQATYYGASDAICTYRLTKVTMKYFQEGRYASKLDNWIIYPLNHFERERISLDGPALANQEVRTGERIVELENEIYKAIGKPINLNSPQQVSEAFQSLGIDTGQYTKTGYMSTSIVLFEQMSKEKLDRWPILKKFIEYKQSYKILSSYIQVLMKEDRERGFLRCNYKTTQVPTGRLASGKDEKNSYYSKINIQSIPKPYEMMYYVVDLGDRKLYNKTKNILCGYQFTPVEFRDGEVEPGEEKFGDKFVGMSEGMSQDLNVRKAFLPGDPECKDKENNTDWIFCSIDYAAQELRIPTNFSREPIWLDAFINNKDVHKETAIKLMGEENYNKEARGKAKGCSSLESFVSTERGLIRTKNLKPEDKIISIEGKGQTYKYEIEERDCFEIEFSNGVKDTVTTDHLYSTYRNGKLEWVRADAMGVGDQVIVGSPKVFSKEYHKYSVEEGFRSDSYHGEVVLDEGLAYVLGVGMADGRLGFKGDRCTGWSMVTHENTDFIVEVLKRYGNPLVDISENYKEVRMARGSFCELIYEMIGRAKGKRVPEDIFSSPKSVIESFIAGYFDADGTCDRTRACIDSVNEEVIGDLALLLSYLGIVTNKYLENIDKYYKDSSGYGSKSKIKYLYRLGIKAGRGMNRFRELPFRESKKSKRLEKWSYEGKENFGYAFNRDYINEVYKKYKNKTKDALYNYQEGRIKGVTQAFAEEVCSGVKDKFPTEIVSMRPVREKVFVMETENHTYLSNMVESHNCNFGILYGMTAESLAERFRISKAEGQEFYDNYKATLSTLFGWVDRVCRRARREGTAYTYFSRPRRVRYYFENNQAGYGYRTIVNTTVQGTGADALKIALLKLWKNLFNHPDNKNDARFLITVHDEVDMAFRRDRLEELVGIAVESMTISLPEWPVTLEVEVSLGFSWGNIFPFYLEGGELRPIIKR